MHTDTQTHRHTRSLCLSLSVSLCARLWCTKTEQPLAFVNVGPGCAVDHRPNSSTFALTTKKRVYFLKAASVAEACEWVAALTSCINTAELDGL